MTSVTRGNTWLWYMTETGVGDPFCAQPLLLICISTWDALRPLWHSQPVSHILKDYVQTRGPSSDAERRCGTGEVSRPTRLWCGSIRWDMWDVGWLKASAHVRHLALSVDSKSSSGRVVFLWYHIQASSEAKAENVTYSHIWSLKSFYNLGFSYVSLDLLASSHLSIQSSLPLFLVLNSRSSILDSRQSTTFIGLIMPTTQRALSPSTGNDTLGGVPEILYFDFQSRGRGQALRLLLEDAQIAYDDTRYSFEEYPEWKETGLVELNPVKTVPVVKLNGKNLTQSYAILRYFAKLLQSYDGSTPEEQYWVDALCDIASDCKPYPQNARLSFLTVDH